MDVTLAKLVKIARAKGFANPDHPSRTTSQTEIEGSEVYYTHLKNRSRTRFQNTIVVIDKMVILEIQKEKMVKEHSRNYSVQSAVCAVAKFIFRLSADIKI